MSDMKDKKKRKLTKVNKDSNLGNGKVWTNRLKKIVLPKVVPKMQFNCQEDINIIDELRELRDVNHYLLGEGDQSQVNGTILSIDFDNAYRSTFHRWFNLVMKAINLPPEFVNWFWTMYKDLCVTIVINKYKALPLQVKRGFMEGHPPSMGAFVLCLSPLMEALEENLQGIQTQDEEIHRIKGFADDLKLFLSDPSEIPVAYDLICRFEAVSGLKMHRDPKREKCQALPFGNHRNYQNWPSWVTVKDKIKVVGAWFSNKGDLEKLNGDLVKKSFHDALHKAWGIRGTVLQKVHFVNTYLFPKVWYISQVFMLDSKIFTGISKEKGILTKALNFIWAGQNERPVRALNFRTRDKGGLGLIEPVTKAKAFLVKNMMKELNYDPLFVEFIYGDTKTLGSNFSVKEIYNLLLEKTISKNGSLIPSREEKRCQVKWSLSWKNLDKVKGLLPEEKMFTWSVVQDMLPVGARIHRANAERRCLEKLSESTKCLEVQDREHYFRLCPVRNECFSMIEMVLSSLLSKNAEYNDIVHMAFNHRNKKILQVAVWFAVKSL